MGKKKKSKEAGKAPKAKLPKEIAGVKIGKELRHAVEPVMRWANHPMVSDTLAAALLAGATALADGKAGSRGIKAGRVAAAAAARASANAASEAATGGSRVGLALAVAAGEIASRIVAACEPGVSAKTRKATPKRATAGRRKAGSKGSARG
jgi:hypothetical protein